eukprot:scaffold67293_cov42-Prasinocladus_malaysianus.AAC.2
MGNCKNGRIHHKGELKGMQLYRDSIRQAKQMAKAAWQPRQFKQSLDATAHCALKHTYYMPQIFTSIRHYALRTQQVRLRRIHT